MRKFNIWAIAASILLIAAILLIIFHLNNEAKSSNQSQLNNSENLETTTQTEQTLKDILSNYRRNPESAKFIGKKINKLYDKNEVIKNQQQINKDIKQTKFETNELGFLFLPQYPSKTPENKEINQIDVPLMLQKDIRWRDINYGSGDAHTLGENGCAILSLAMVHSSLSKRIIEPTEILDWSKENYYIENSGTSWQIFGDFAEKFNYDFYNFGNNFYNAMEDVKKGHVVIASVQPGYFTDVGHIIVIRGYDDGIVYVNDPNDDSSKLYSVKGVKEEILLNEGKNYWSFKLK